MTPRSGFHDHRSASSAAVWALFGGVRSSRRPRLCKGAAGETTSGLGGERVLASYPRYASTASLSSLNSQNSEIFPSRKWQMNVSFESRVSSPRV